MKRGITCGSTPMITTDRNDAPVARTASTCFIEISSIASANSLTMKPSEATISASMPASAPKPTALTNRMATMTGWNERHSAISAARRPGERQRHQVARGREPERQRQQRCRTTVARTAICRLSIMPLVSSSSLSGAILGGNIRERKRAPWSRPTTKRAQVMSRIVLA